MLSSNQVLETVVYAAMLFLTSSNVSSLWLFWLLMLYMTMLGLLLPKSFYCLLMCLQQND